MKKLILISFSFLLLTNIFSQKLDIKIFSKQNIKSLILSAIKSDYNIIVDSQTVHTLKKNKVVLLSIINDSINVKTLHNQIGKFKNLSVQSNDNDGYLRIKPISPESKYRDYDDNLIITIEDEQLKLINNVELDKYIAGVVESETGIKSKKEFYKTQAIIARTYTLRNLFRHAKEGFHLCDNVHCHAYYGKSLLNKKIVEAANETSGLIIVDTNLTLISATYHSNCGGQTLGSEDVWLTPLSYLKSVKDTFCLNSRNSKWEKIISVKKWKNYLERNGIKTEMGVFNLTDFTFKQPKRMKYYRYNEDSLLIKNIRNDWKLKSTFFNIEQDNNKLIFKGKGYGHGVGLCQEGAMKMAEYGYSYEKIIKYYYKNVFIVSLETLDFFKKDANRDEEKASKDEEKEEVN